MHHGRGNWHHEYFVKTDKSHYELESANEEKDLRVLFTPDLTFSRQVTMAPNKVNRLIGAIRNKKVIQIHGWAYFCTIIYKPMVIEYTLDIHTQSGIPLTRLTEITWKITMACYEVSTWDYRDLPYEERPRNIKLQSLAYREEEEEIWSKYIIKILHGLEDMHSSELTYYSN